MRETLALVLYEFFFFTMQAVSTVTKDLFCLQKFSSGFFEVELEIQIDKEVVVLSGPLQINLLHFCGALTMIQSIHILDQCFPVVKQKLMSSIFCF